MLSREIKRKVKGGLGEEMFSQIKQLIDTDKSDFEELRSRIICELIRHDWGEQPWLLALRRADLVLFKGA